MILVNAVYTSAWDSKQGGDAVGDEETLGATEGNPLGAELGVLVGEKVGPVDGSMGCIGTEEGPIDGDRDGS